MAEALPVQQVNWLLHPTGGKKELATEHRRFNVVMSADFQISVRSISLVFLALDGEAHQNVPDILRGTLVAAEANTGP